MKRTPTQKKPPNADCQAWPRLCTCLLFFPLMVYRSTECICHPIVCYIVGAERSCKDCPVPDRKEVNRSSRANCFWFSNCGANSATISSNSFLSLSPSLLRAISAYVPVYHPRNWLVDIGLVLVFFAVDRHGLDIFSQHLRNRSECTFMWRHRKTTRDYAGMCGLFLEAPRLP